MAKTINDVNDILLTQLKNLEAKDMTPTKMEMEIRRSTAMTKISGEISKNLKLKLDGMRIAASGPYGPKDLPEEIGLNFKK